VAIIKWKKNPKNIHYSWAYRLKGDHALQESVQLTTAIVENNMEIPQKPKSRSTTDDPSGDVCKETKSAYQNRHSDVYCNTNHNS
jgi:hypothetical protein